MASIHELRTWFERDLRFATWDENIKVAEADSTSFDVRFYTDTNEYQLTTSVRGDGSSCINAVVRPRKARAGHTETRPRRLFPLDRIPFGEKAWRQLLGCIVGLELVRVQRRDEMTGNGSPPASARFTP